MRNLLLKLSSFDIWVIGLSAAASFISQRMLLVTVVIIGVFSFIRWVTHGYLSIRTPVDLPIILLTLMLAVTLWVTGFIPVTFPQVLRLLTGIGLFYTIVNWTNSPYRMRWLARGVGCSGLLVSLYAFISVQWNSTKLVFIPPSLYAHFPVLVSDPVNPNVMAGTLIILLPCILGILWFCNIHMKWCDLILAVLAVVVMAIVLLLTQSRGGILALGETLVLMVVLRWRRGWWFLVVVAALVAGLLLSVGPMPVIRGILANTTLGGIDGRLELWSRALYMIQDFPFTGVGMGSYGRVGNLLYPFFVYASSTPDHAHNIYLQIAVDLGIPGLIAWLAIWILVAICAWQIYQRALRIKDRWIEGLSAGLICSQLAMATYGIMGAVPWGMLKPAPLVWMVWGVVVAGWYVYSQ